MRLGISLLLSFVLFGCESGAAPGASCTRASDCSAPLACHFGRCRAGCAANRDCPTGASCLLDVDQIGACTVETDLGCETGVGRECASGLVCVADHCRQICSATQGCATGSLCTPTGGGTSFCVPTDFDAGPPPDDAGADATGSDAPTQQDAAVTTGVGTACIGDGFICATRASDGAVFCWGEEVPYALGGAGSGCGSHGDTSTPLQVATLTNVDQLACGSSWACAHQSSGEVLCWGNSYGGQIVPGTQLCDRTPHVVAGAAFTDGELVSSMQLVCVHDRGDDTLVCWGADQGTVHPAEPAPDPPTETLPSLTTVTHLVTGAIPRFVGIDDGMPLAADSHGGACYVESSDESVWCWGSNLMGQRGQAITAPLFVDAVQVAGLPSPVTRMALGTGSTCVLAGAANDLWCWGVAEHGELARAPTGLETCTGGNTWTCSHTPLQYTSIHFSEIASHASAATTCGIAVAGGGATAADVYCWGSGEFATNTRTDSSRVLDPTAGHVMRASGGALSSVREVRLAFRNACAIDTSGALYCWGENLHQQLQAPSTTFSTSGTALQLTPF